MRLQLSSVFMEKAPHVSGSARFKAVPFGGSAVPPSHVTVQGSSVSWRTCVKLGHDDEPAAGTDQAFSCTRHTIGTVPSSDLSGARRRADTRSFRLSSCVPFLRLTGRELTCKID